MPSNGQPAPRSELLCGAWATVDDIEENDRPLLSDEQWPAWLLTASEILYALTGKQWSGNGCSATVMLRNQPPGPGEGAWPYFRTWGTSAQSYWWWSFAGWSWFPRYVGLPPQPMAIKLPHREVQAITAVYVDQEPFTAYRLLESGWIERTDGRRWTEYTGDTVIQYTFGCAAPESGVRAVVRLAVELVREWLQDPKCRLPKRTTSVTRQGVTVAMTDPQVFIKQGYTGLDIVDLWIRAVNPYNRQQAATVWSPDIPRALRVPPTP
jgi:hypothetical protein